jgi:hypothetical protein
MLCTRGLFVVTCCCMHCLYIIFAGVSQAWMLSSGLPPDITAQGQSNSWYGLQGLASLTALDLGGSHFSNAVWVRHMCPLLTSSSKLQRLMLAHCSIPPGKMQHLLPGLSAEMLELNLDRWVGVDSVKLHLQSHASNNCPGVRKGTCRYWRLGAEACSCCFSWLAELRRHSRTVCGKVADRAVRALCHPVHVVTYHMPTLC